MNKFIPITLLLCIISSNSFSQVSAVSSNTFSVNVNGTILRMPYYRNYSISSGDPRVTHAVIMIHGTDRNADDYYNTLFDAAQQSVKSDSSLLIAPQFLIEDDINAHSLNNEYLFWTNSGWKQANNSLSTAANPRNASISSYAMLDTIIMRISKNFPNLKSIYVAGHSAGGQVVARYVATNQVEQKIPQCMRYVPANPSSYLYFNDERWVQGTTWQYAKPSATDISGCPDYNDWHSGFSNMAAESPYAVAVGAAAMTSQFQQREVYFMIGGDDNDPNNSSLDKSCGSMMQGAHRFERANVYFKYLGHYFGNAIYSNHFLDTVPGVAHSHSGMFTSAEGKKYLFGDICKPVVTAVSPEEKRADILISGGAGPGEILISASQNFSVEIFSLAGQLVMKQTFSKGTHLCHISSGVQGIIFIRIVNDNGAILTKKIFLATLR